jgi:hypothetical protein
MTYPDGDTTTTITGTAEAADGSILLTWKELDYIREGRPASAPNSGSVRVGQTPD